jgi:hypothetical protein
MHEVPRVDRSALQFGSADTSDDSVLYWRSREIDERLEAIQNLRRTFYGDAASQRLHRFL